MYVVKTDCFDPAIDLLVDMLTHKSMPVHGATQKVRFREEGRKLGEAEGMLAGIAAVLNGRRCERYAKLDQIQKLTAGDLMKFWRDVCEKWENEVEVLTVEDTKDPKARMQAKREAETAIFHWAQDEFAAYAYPDELEERENNRHRTAVLAGTEEVTEADQAWLDEELAAAEEAANRLKKIAKSRS